MTQFIGYSDTLKLDAKIKYNLVSVVVHCGKGAKDGHYVTYTINASNKKWSLMNDSHLIPADPSHVLDELAYMLVYRKC